MKKKQLIALLLATVMLIGTLVPVHAETSEVTVESVTAQLQAIDTLQQMQDNRGKYTIGSNYDVDTTKQTTIAAHQAKRAEYETYLNNMFAARAAAQAAYDSLTPEQQAQIDPVLVAKLNNELPTTMSGKVYSVTPDSGEYPFELVKDFGLAYEVTPHMVAKKIPQTFIIVDTSDGRTSWTADKKYVNGESDYEVTYCCDFTTDANGGSNYKRINLEDSSYFSEYAAQHIRAIALNSYPYVTLDEMKAGLIAGGLNKTFVDSLTRADMISAVQMAIWHFSNPEDVPANYPGYTATLNMKPYDGTYYTITHDYTNELWEWLPNKGRKTYDTRVAYRINNLIHYLCNLEGVKAEPATTVISNVKVGRVDLVPISEELYNMGLHITLNTGAKASDDVKLNITSYSLDGNGNKVVTSTRSVKVTEATEYNMTINAKYGDSIEVSAEGTQSLGRSAYFYEAEGGRSASQSMLGIAEGETPVRAAMAFSFNRDIETGLRIYKKSSVDKTPISEITFKVYKTNPENGEKLSETPTAEEIAKYAIDANLVGTMITDETGYAALELESYGTYLVIEEHNTAKVEKPVDPFYITLPHAVSKEVEGENGTETVIEYVDIVSVYPKNTPTPPPPPPPPPPLDVVGVFNIIKYDVANTTHVLSGAKFQVYRPATDTDTETETLVCNGLEVTVVPITIDGEDLILITDENGAATSPELTCGTYYIKETKAPTGYVKLKEAISVTVKTKELTTVDYTYVGNERGFLLPETGGIGNTVLPIVGGAVVLLAALFLVTKKRMI